MQRNDSEILTDKQMAWEAKLPFGARRPPAPSPRLRMDWEKLSEVLAGVVLIVLGSVIATYVPIRLMGSGILVLEVVGATLVVIYVILAIAVISGALEFK